MTQPQAEPPISRFPRPRSYGLFRRALGNGPSTTLRADTAIYGGAIIVDRFLALLLLPLLTRAIGAAEYGVWTQTLVASSMLLPLILFAFPTSIVRSFSAVAQASHRLHSFERMGGIALALFGLTAIVLWVAREPIANLIWGNPAGAVLIPSLLAVLAGDAGIEYANAWLRAAGRIGLISAGLLVRSVLRYAVVWALVAGGSVPIADWLPVYALTLMALASGLLVVSVIVLRGAARGKPQADPVAEEGIPSLLRFSAPLVALAAFATVGANIDRFLLVGSLGLDTVAVYSASASLCALPAAMVGVLGFTLFPVLSRAWHDGSRDEARRLTHKALTGFTVTAVPLSALIALAGPWLLPRLTTATYQAPWPVFVGLSIAVVLSGLYQILLYTLLLDGRSSRVLAMGVAGAALSAAFNLVLIPAFGMAGAAAAAALSSAAILAWAVPQAKQALNGRRHE